MYCLFKTCLHKWLYSVMVSTSDSDSGNPSSIPGTTFFFCFFLTSIVSSPSFILLDVGYDFVTFVYFTHRANTQQSYDPAP
jgi:hypothetical protein